MKLLRDESLQLGALPPSPRDLSHSCQNDRARRQIARPPPIPATESALGLRPRSALSSAQVFPEWITATSPCNDLSANGDYPLNFEIEPEGVSVVTAEAYVRAERERSPFRGLGLWMQPSAFGCVGMRSLG